MAEGQGPHLREQDLVRTIRDTGEREWGAHRDTEGGWGGFTRTSKILLYTSARTRNSTFTPTSPDGQLGRGAVSTAAAAPPRAAIPSGTALCHPKPVHGLSGRGRQIAGQISGPEAGVCTAADSAADRSGLWCQKCEYVLAADQLEQDESASQLLINRAVISRERDGRRTRTQRDSAHPYA